MAERQKPSRSDWRTGLSPFLLYLVGVATLGPFQFGYHLSELNAPERALRCLPDPAKLPSAPSNPSNDSSLPTCIPMSAAQFAVVSSIFTLGGFCGALAAGPLLSRKGRLYPMRLETPFFIIGSILEAVAPSIPIIALGRYLSGVGAGASIVVGPIYISEISPSGSKGVLGALTQVSINLGILLSQVLGYFYSYGVMWRLVLGVASFIGVLQLLCMLFVVESPEWLGVFGRKIAARKALHIIRGSKIDPEEANKWGSAEELEEEQQGLLSDPNAGSNISSSESASHSLGILEALRHPDHYRAIVAVISVMLAQQLCGINGVMMYSVSFLSPLLPTAAGLITVTVGGLNVVITIACAPLADRLGRKACILLSIAGMGTSALLLALGIMFKADILTGIVTLLFVASFAVGLGPVPFILASELASTEAVGATQSCALASSWIATFLVAQFFPIINSYMENGKVFFIFTGLAAFFFIFISWWVPESKGKKDADEVWGREIRERRVD